MFYARLSLDLHNKDMSKKDPVKVANDIQKDASPWQIVDDTFMLHSFGHLDGYSALYYTYMWSLVIAKDIFAEISSHERPKHEQASATKYMNAILKPGGSQPAADMIQQFLGRPFNAEHFETWLKR